MRRPERDAERLRSKSPRRFNYPLQPIGNSRRAGSRDVTLTIYPEIRHETLNEPNRKQVLADLTAWMGARIDD